MESIDTKKLDTAIIYLRRMAEGNNPVNNSPAAEDAVLNDPNVIRCMYFVKDVLEKVRRNNGYIGAKPRNSDKQEFPLQHLERFAYRADKPISKFVEQLNEDLDEMIYRRLTYRPITLWLRTNGYLTEQLNQETNKNNTIPTEKGLQMGITCEKRINGKGVEYFSVLYGQKAQEYIVQNIEQILGVEEETDSII